MQGNHQQKPELHTCCEKQRWCSKPRIWHTSTPWQGRVSAQPKTCSELTPDNLFPCNHTTTAPHLKTIDFPSNSGWIWNKKRSDFHVVKPLPFGNSTQHKKWKNAIWFSLFVRQAIQKTRNKYPKPGIGKREHEQVKANCAQNLVAYQILGWN